MRDRVLKRLLLATVLIHFVFAIWPTLDIAASRVFFQADGTFLLAKSTIAEDIRMPIWLASVGMAIAAIVMLVASLLRGANARTSWRLWAFATTLYILGPGILVNVLLKQNWGRARPVMVEEFGGEKVFTPPFEIAGQCVSNCSFVSGEAASAAAMVVVLAVCFVGNFGKKGRAAVYTALMSVFVLAAGMRVASGRHFLSDVIFAGLFMLIIARYFYTAFGVTAPQTKDLLPRMCADLFGFRRRTGAVIAAHAQAKVVEAETASVPAKDATTAHV